MGTYLRTIVIKRMGALIQEEGLMLFVLNKESTLITLNGVMRKLGVK